MKLRNRKRTAAFAVAAILGVVAAVDVGAPGQGAPSMARETSRSEAPQTDTPEAPVLDLAVEPVAVPDTAVVAAPLEDAPIKLAPPSFDGLAAAAKPRRRVEPAPEARAEGEGGTWALVVGINDYPGGAHDLLFAVNDADDVDAALARYDVAPARRLVLRDGEATAAGIRKGLAWLTERAGPDATAIVSFAGHARERGRDRQAFVAADGVELSDRELAGLLRPLRAKAVWLNFGTCFGGGFNELVAPGRILTAASAAGQIAYESTAIGRSYLGEYMVRRGLLAADSSGAVAQSFNRARDAIARDYPDRVPVMITGPETGDIQLRSPVAPTTSPSNAAPMSNPEPATASSEPSPSPSSPSSSPSSESKGEQMPEPAPEEGDGCARLTDGAVLCGP